MYACQWASQKNKLAHEHTLVKRGREREKLLKISVGNVSTPVESQCFGNVYNKSSTHVF